VRQEGDVFAERSSLRTKDNQVLKKRKVKGPFKDGEKVTKDDVGRFPRGDDCEPWEIWGKRRCVFDESMLSSKAKKKKNGRQRMNEPKSEKGDTQCHK